MNPFTRKAKVLPFEILDDVLVIHPTGKSLHAGESVVEKEITELHRKIEELQIRRVVVDIGIALHFGSLVIGALLMICVKVRENAGRAALCQATASMLETLQIMKVETLIPYFATLDEALAHVKSK
ncbi:MAG: hypothetical protein O3A00_17170 [Planctomycetota bacterium]|nr:hypothetical protein [Planctomycetota bacterium]